MMQPLPDLLLVTAVCAVFGLAVTIPILGLRLSVPIVAIKMLIPFVYFQWFFDGQWVIEDDLTYLEESRALLERGWNPVTVWFGEGVRMLYWLVNWGPHVLYTWWNLLAQYLFGKHYFAPVIMNVGLSFAAGAALYHLVRATGFYKQYSVWLVALFLLHWDVVAWSSFQNRKEILILTLTLGAFAGIVGMCVKGRGIRSMLLHGGVAALCFALLGMSRFYVTFLIAVSLGAWFVVTRSGRNTVSILAVSLFLMLVALLFYLPEEMSEELQTVTLNWREIAYGLFRFPLTPRPWAIEIGYTFVTLGAWVHWLLFLPMLYGLLRLWTVSELARIVLIYAGVVVAFYAFVPFLQDDRHRVQIVFVIAWGQFHWFVIMYNRFVAKGRGEAMIPAWPMNMPRTSLRRGMG